MIVTIICGQPHSESSNHIASASIKQLFPNNVFEFFSSKDLSHLWQGYHTCMNQGMKHCPHPWKRI